MEKLVFYVVLPFAKKFKILFSSHYIHVKLSFGVQKSVYYLKCPLCRCPLLGECFIEF